MNEIVTGNTSGKPVINNYKPNPVAQHTRVIKLS